MEEDKLEQQAPERKMRNKFKILTLSLLFIAIFIIAGTVTVESTSSSSFCETCHEMKPETQTFKVSSHSQLQCNDCHIQSGAANLAKAKMDGLVRVYKKVTDNFPAPIHMPTQIPNSTCEKCHNMKTRNVTTSGDIIIPHGKHIKEDIKCVECHSGVAHGDIADRNVTFKTDYEKWNETLAKQMMSEKYTQPKMEECISCHITNNVSTACKTCHSSGMEPASHSNPNFMKGEHGQLAEKNIDKCNSCHSYMSDNPIKSMQTKTVIEQFIENGSSSTGTISAAQYAKENTFCKTCHAKKPASHDSDFFNDHGKLAGSNIGTCKACHDTSKLGSNTSNQVICATCHPATHNKVSEIATHPISLNGITKPSATCYKCHDQNTCEKCHRKD